VKTDHIFFDARFIRFDHHDGISRFSAGLFAALNRRTKVTAIISDTRQLLKLPRGCDYVLANDPTSIRELFIAPSLNRAGAGVVFSPMQTMGSWFRRYKLILTLHDLIYYRHPAPPPEFNWLIRTGWRLFHMVYWPQRVFLNRADAVATVSKTSKRLRSSTTQREPSRTTKPTEPQRFALAALSAWSIWVHSWTTRTWKC
jgi:hypothetical protein